MSAAEKLRTPKNEADSHLSLVHSSGSAAPASMTLQAFDQSDNQLASSWRLISISPTAPDWLMVILPLVAAATLVYLSFSYLDIVGLIGTIVAFILTITYELMLPQSSDNESASP